MTGMLATNDEAKDEFLRDLSRIEIHVDAKSQRARIRNDGFCGGKFREIVPGE